jgi:hypothetical protein
LNTDLLSDPFEIEKDEIHQAYNDVYAKVGIESAIPDSGKLSYKLLVSSDYFWDHYENKEPHVDVYGEIGFPVNSFYSEVKLGYNYFRLENSYGSNTQKLFNIHPLISKRKEEWSVNIGAKFSVLRSFLKDSVYIYPDANIRFRVIQNALVATVGASGYLQENSYKTQSKENPYLIPGSTPVNTNHPLIFYGGIEGYLSRKASYKFTVSWESMQDMIFYSNSDTTDYQNQFDYVLNDADRIGYHFEFSWSPLTYLNFSVGANYYSYETYGIEHPWHRPSADMTFSARYNFKQKLYAEMDFLAIGKRYASDINTLDVIELAAIYDLNLKLEYKYSNILSVFVNLYNLTNRKHYFWNQYRSQGINILAGVGYKF